MFERLNVCVSLAEFGPTSETGRPVTAMQRQREREEKRRRKMEKAKEKRKQKKQKGDIFVLVYHQMTACLLFEQCREAAFPSSVVAGIVLDVHLPRVSYRIKFKLLALMHGAIHANTPRYLADRVSAYVPSRSLRCL